MSLIKVDLWKGCFLLLTPEEWRAGIRRGKARRRREQYEKRQAEVVQNTDNFQSRDKKA